MPNKNLTEIVVVLDKSGSMDRIKDDTIGGFNSFLAAQKESKDGKAKLTFVTFSYDTKTIVDGLDIQEVSPLTTKDYVPGGGTALLDAIGGTIQKLEDRYTEETDSNKIPEKVIFAVITDGEENSSRKYGLDQVKKMIKHQTNRHGWEFAFLGANLDAVSVASSIGIDSSRSLNFVASSAGINDSYGVFSNATISYRSAGQAIYNTKGTSLEDINQHIGTTTSDGN